MIKVKRENVIYSISEEEKGDYLKKGYSLLDSHGKEVKEKNKKSDDNEAIKELNETITLLTKQVEKLTTEKNTLETEKVDLTKQVEKLTKNITPEDKTTNKNKDKTE